jgi:hypothetical protein
MENISIQNPTITKAKKRKVSYSQFSNWFNCPHHWYLDCVKGLKVFDESINTCFGTAIHETIQLYIETLYKESAAAADLHNLKEHFKNGFERELSVKKISFTEDEKTGFIDDGNEIINAFSNITNRIKYFPSNKYEFIAVEDEILMPIKNNVDFICYIDVVLKEKLTGRYRIIDIKTSTRGWNSYQKEDPAKYSQVLLYKAFFGKKYNVPLNMIDVEFFILKRKLYENSGFPQSRIQYFVPNSNEKKVKTTLTTFSQFVGDCFKPDGSFVDNVKIYPKIPGKAKKHCKYCPHYKKNCDAKADVED